MASTGEEHGLFWNSENGDRTYDANSFEYWLKKFFTSGVFNGDLQVEATSGMTLRVGSGYANVDGKVKFWNAEFNVVLDAANSTYPRIDTVVITRDNVNRTITCEKVTGAYSVDAPQPTPPVRDSETWQLVIAQVYVPAGATGITQSNITDTRPDPDLCGYITGTVTEMDFSQFSAQFEAYYNEFVAGHEADFDTWEATQQAAYAAWYAEVVAQMQDDHEAFEEWFQNLQNQLDTDQLTHLQAQIDDLYSMAPAGSYITVTTEETTLYSMDVTITDGTHTITSEFNNEGVAEFKTLPYVGNFMISSTDGNDRAHTTVNIPYFGRYAYEIAFWNAYVNIDGGDALAGAEVVVTNSEDVAVATVTLNNHGQGVFNAKEPDYYTFTAEYSGGVAVAELDVEEQMTYNLQIYAGWKSWVELGGLDPSDYETLEDVFDDEPAVRRLMTIHASADYLIAMATADITVLDDFVDNDTAMKWIGLRDYVCDGLTNIAGVEAMFMASDYWERYLKDHVPVMTGNVAPYGTASCASIATGYEPYKAFDGNSSSYYFPSSTAVTGGHYIYYEFVNPVMVKAVDLVPYFTSSASKQNACEIQASNDLGGASWTTIATLDFTSALSNVKISVNLENNNYYKRYRITKLGNPSPDSRIGFYELQFYGRALNVSVPKMTSNSAPYGVASANQERTAAYTAFDPASSGWGTTDTLSGSWLRYDFGKPVKALSAFVSTNASIAVKYKIEGSKDGSTWSELTDEITGRVSNTASIGSTFSKNIDEYRYYRFYCTGGGNQYLGGIHVNFFGLDYTEREFATGSTMKYLYDHGVELETITSKTVGSGTVTEKRTNDLYLYKPNNGDNLIAALYTNEINLDGYNRMRMIAGDIYYSSSSTATPNSYAVVNSADDIVPNVSPLANIGYLIGDANIPNNFALDINNISGNKVIVLFVRTPSNATRFTQESTCKELWIE